MSAGSVGDQRPERSEDDAVGRFADALAPGEEVRCSWTAAQARWANESGIRPSPSSFAATDRRLLFSTGETTTSVGWDHVRAVEVDAGVSANLSTPLLVCGGVGLLVGLVVVTRSAVDGVGLIALSLVMLVGGRVVGDYSQEATVTVVIDNERQRLTFSADEEVAATLDRLASDS
ncbi:hypothetical protein NGM10_01645 [Halorussus salilacus]|uniref:hypothetical protein n=1 Tax=Halorussus salilacus TaxID=2953750 RepID=UPI0020A0C17C|nr:hypothetical protein [Halorussus salilacus]USZ68455.1 hypothetical protein NGM10_01645 [Halorussus salilacus]